MLADVAVFDAARRDFATLALVPQRRAAAGLFLRHLARGERVARLLAVRAAAIAPGRHEARFLRAQARQEAMHALVFDTFAARLGAAAVALDPCPFAAFESRVLAAIGRRDFVEAVIATQVVLEALGEALLARLDAGLMRQGAGFHRLRAVILRQEAAHHAFGTGIVAGLLERQALLPATAAVLARPYLALVDAMIASGRDALAPFGLAPEDIAADVRTRLPQWICA